MKYCIVFVRWPISIGIERLHQFEQQTLAIETGNWSNSVIFKRHAIQMHTHHVICSHTFRTRTPKHAYTCVSTSDDYVFDTGQVYIYLLVLRCLWLRCQKQHKITYDRTLSPVWLRSMIVVGVRSMTMCYMYWCGEHFRERSRCHGIRRMSDVFVFVCVGGGGD